jgi:energy-coupling factor transporter ATP-binding protein EcfA2
MTTVNDAWAGLDASTAVPIRAAPATPAAAVETNPFDPASDPDDWAAWEKASKEDRAEQLRLWAETRTHAETQRQLVTLRGRRRAQQLLDAELADAARAAVESSTRVLDGASFLLDVPDLPPALWGEGTNILWARGESLIIAGPQGVGKTTLAGQLLRGALALQPEVLGFPVTPCDNKVGYLAMDRPEQARRNLGRMFKPDEREYIAEFLRFWTGPLPTDVAADPETLVRVARMLEVDMLFVDSLKDVAIGLSKDEVGAAYNRARQMCLAEGVQLVELHHMVKNGADGKAPKQLRDVYGATWITAGAGSVVVLWGDAGDPVVEFLHLKQPLDEVGPFRILHNRDTGLSSVFHEEDTDIVTIARRCASTGLTAIEAARLIYGKEEPTKSDVEKVRRKLGKLVQDGLLIFAPPVGNGAGAVAKWFAAAPSNWDEPEPERYR